MRHAMGGEAFSNRIYKGKNPRKVMPPRMNCPVCSRTCFTYSSEEISPETRKLYFACSNPECRMTFSALLSVEAVIIASAISTQFRPAMIKDAKPPGHDFGQMPLFERKDSAAPDPA